MKDENSGEWSLRFIIACKESDITCTKLSTLILRVGPGGNQRSSFCDCHVFLAVAVADLSLEKLVSSSF
jgi:hypothetical protein